jgi:hypothetical protein
MSFRRDKQKALRWQAWLQRNFDTVACGVPGEIVENEKYWFYFLDHGYFKPPGSENLIVDIGRMSEVDAEALCLFLEQDDLYPRSSTLRDLRNRLGKGDESV